MATKKNKAPKKENGRPCGHTQALADRICQQLAEGKSLRSICKEEGMPSQSMVYRWLEKNGEFREQYSLARTWQADTLADEILEIADESSNDTYVDDDGSVKTNAEVVARSRVRIEARKWIASKLAPKKYGDRQMIDMELKDVTPMADRMKQARERAKQAG